MNSKLKELLKPILVLTLIAAVMAGLLSGTNLLTRDKIAQLAEQAEKQAVAKVIKGDEYTPATLEYDGKSYDYFVATGSGKTVGYAFTVSQNGYGGAVTSVVGIDTEGKITAVEITDVSNETPGLGQNAKNDDFKSRFAGKEGALSVVKNNPSEDEIQAVTGATITSTAVTDSVNFALKLYEEIAKEGAAK